MLELETWPGDGKMWNFRNKNAEFCRYEHNIVGFFFAVKRDTYSRSHEFNIFATRLHYGVHVSQVPEASGVISSKTANQNYDTEIRYGKFHV